MATVTAKTVRVTGMPLDTDPNEFLSLATMLDGGVSRTLAASGPTSRLPGISFATQSGTKTGTITFQSEYGKTKALKNTTWRFDDVFDGVTVLFSPDEPELE
jgi:hypothetical protein